ncbi:ABC transporter permease [Chitinilyticum litopenaei]|uniref:ABC transporter permease n=1 Tax=Chitinilyticum litopenaei TaxID=1121276 RepID=UPI00048D0664|nr:ABC transporter permease subunit [Chitinilyticum litopenaei]
MLSTIALNTLRMGHRNHGARIVLVLSLLLLGVAWLGGNFSPRQPQTVALDVGISVLRILMTLLTLYWVQELVAKEVERKTILWSLSYPQSRNTFLVGRYLGIFILISLALTFLATATLIAGQLALGDYQQTTAVAGAGAYWLTIALFAVDLLAVSSFTLLVSSIATVPMLPFFMGLAFAICARSIGPTLSYLASPESQGITRVQAVSASIERFGWLLPDLSRLDVRHIALYQIAPDKTAIAAAASQTLVFSLMMLVLACVAFQRRQFN